MKKLLTLILALGFFVGSAYAHNGMQHVMGTVTAVTDKTVSVKTMDGTVQTVAVSPDTKYLRGDAGISLKDIKAGDHIVIHAAKKDGKLVAAEVKLGAMKNMNGDMSGMDMSGSKTKP
jgi:hypothetical protein